jgi:hypothetical protein
LKEHFGEDEWQALMQGALPGRMGKAEGKWSGLVEERSRLAGILKRVLKRRSGTKLWAGWLLSFRCGLKMKHTEKLRGMNWSGKRGEPLGVTRSDRPSVALASFAITGYTPNEITAIDLSVRVRGGSCWLLGKSERQGNSWAVTYWGHSPVEASLGLLPLFSLSTNRLRFMGIGACFFRCG